MEKIEYDLTDIEDFFESWDTPQEAAAKLDRVAVVLTNWFIKAGDPCGNIHDLKDSIEFLANLRMSIGNITPINKDKKE